MRNEWNNKKLSRVYSQGTNREHALGTYRTPRQSCSCEHGGARADEVSWLVLRAKVRDIREHPHLNSNRHEARDDRRDYLAGEHRPWRDLHVMAELEVPKE